ncbi:MAG TPA: cyclic nucleotide-binding domain-containing protein [Spirochaetales bacterium]|nr:cyclic nucleotide-binding domain-containing protein [Spirochaetales bacterium]
MRDQADLTRTIRSIPGMETLDQAGADALASCAELASVAEGELLYREGEPSKDVYFVVSGLMEARMRIPGRERDTEEVFRTIKSGDLTGELAFLDGGRRESTVAARERSVLLKLGGAELRGHCESNPALAAAVFHALGRTAAERCRDVSLELRNAYGAF